MVDYESLPEGYIKRRKTRGVMLAFSIYAMIIYLAISMNVNMSFPAGCCIFGVLCIINVIFVCMNDAAKITYNNIPIPNCSEVKVFSIKETLVLLLPMILGGGALVYFYSTTIWYVMVFVGCMGAAYIGARVFSRPLDEYDRRYSRY